MLYNFDGFIYTNEFDPAFPGYKKNGKYVPLHIYVYWKHTGILPKKGKSSIHHIDGDRKNNKFENLKLLTVQEHGKVHLHSNKSKLKCSINRAKTGLFGFYGTSLQRHINPEMKCWRSRIVYNGKEKNLGYFNDPLSAKIVYEFVQNEIWGP